MYVHIPHLAQGSQIPVFALHQELSRDISGWLDFRCFFVLLMELFNFLFQIYHLKGKNKNLPFQIVISFISKSHALVPPPKLLLYQNRFLEFLNASSIS